MHKMENKKIIKNKGNNNKDNNKRELNMLTSSHNYMVTIPYFCI
jgi:hypothetical protein